ncbi:hypothetical protein [Providencia phage PSTRCR_114]|uniref:Uncharacterized protein n=1 Tax=Providencia phage PSTRCR_114 TaxID=2800824 RepID=A0A7T6ZN07_9CAUD|nr:hypothetical protein [Providencia phage PSTRCR_114]
MSNLKVGDKVRLVHDILGFKEGQVVEVFQLFGDGIHLFKGANTEYKHCDGEEGAWLEPQRYKVLYSTPAHPHADLMLKYAQIAQYDDKPWEQFEYLASDGTWVTKNESSPFRSSSKYRLKPQTLVVQIGQTWVSRSNGQEVQVFGKPYPSEGGCGEVGKWVIGVVLDESINLVTTVVISEVDLIHHFKLKK